MLNSATPIPLFSAQAANEGVDLAAAAKRVLDSHWYVLGTEVESFEKEFAHYIGTAHCAGVANGTDALELALRAVGVQAGDTVVTVANAGFYTSTALLAIGATPQFVDVDPHTGNMAPAALEQALRHRPAAVVVTHLYGRMAPVTELCALAGAAAVPLIEDCAQAHGAALQGRRAGSFGQLGCFSFYPTKNLGAVGDGGAVVTNEPVLNGRIRQLRQYGWAGKYRVEAGGGRNSRLDELQAAVLRAKLPRLDAWNEQRRDIARRYDAAFADLPLQCPGVVSSEYVAHLYVARTARRDALRAFLASRNIATEIHYPVPDHRQTVLAGSGGPSLPATELLAEQIVTLPCFPGLPEEAVERVIAAVREFFQTQ